MTSPSMASSATFSASPTPTTLPPRYVRCSHSAGDGAANGGGRRGLFEFRIRPSPAPIKFAIIVAKNFSGQKTT